MSNNSSQLLTHSDTLLEYLMNNGYFENEGSNMLITEEQIKVFSLRIMNNTFVECLQLLNLDVDTSSDNIVATLLKNNNTLHQ